MPSFGGWKYSQPQSQGRLSQAFWHWQFATRTWLYFTRRGGSKLLCVRDCLPACLPACNRLPCASEWEAMSRSKSCREICRWEPGLRFYLSHARVSFCLAGASLLRSATARVVSQPDWNYSHSGHDRVQSRSSEGGSAKKLFCCLVAFYAFHKEKCSALKKGNIFFIFFYLRTSQCLRCVGRRQPNSLSCTHTKSILYIKNNNKKKITKA